MLNIYNHKKQHIYGYKYKLKKRLHFSWIEHTNTKRFVCFILLMKTN